MNISEASEVLFSKSVLVLHRDHEQRKINIHINIASKLSSSRHRKELYIQLTSSEDLFFLQTLTLSEEDFQSLKSQQGLLVDFDSFAQKFIDLLELCLSEQSNISPRFVLHFISSTGLLSTSTTGTLEVVETNPFKHLVHLSLKFIPGNDESIKKYLVSCLKIIQEEKKNIEEQLKGNERDLSSRLAHTQQVLTDQTKQLNEMKEDYERKYNEAITYYKQELNKEKENNSKMQLNYENRINDDKSRNEERFHKTINELEAKWRQAEGSNKELTDHKYRYESLIRELKSKVQSLEEERRLFSKDLQNLRRQNTNLDSDRHERDKTLNHLRTRVAVLEQELKDKDHVIHQANNLTETAVEQKSRLEMELENMVMQKNQLEENVKCVSAEVIKGNEIIQKLQTELKAAKSRVKMLTIVTTKQEKVIEEKDSLLLMKEQEQRNDKEELAKLKNEVAQQNKNSEEMALKFNQSQETIKNNENIINWLNKQLNEQSVGRLSSTHNASGGINVQGSLRSNNSARSNMGIQSNTRNQIPYRPILKKPHFQPDGISPIVSFQPPIQPLRTQQRQQISTPVIPEQIEPILDPKYLMRKKVDEVKNNINDDIINNENRNPINDINTKQTFSAKPFKISSTHIPK